jgi:CTP-dependent riboflavin kinase
VNGRSFTGIVTPGRGRAVSLLSEDRVLDDLHGRIGFRVVPGTLNLRLPEAFDRRLLPTYIGADEIDAGWETRTGQAGYFLGPVLIARRYRGIAFQADEPGYPDDLIELMAETHLRTALELDDGDAVSFAILDG